MDTATKQFQENLGEKWLILTRIECFRTVTPIWIDQWLRNGAQSLK